MRNLVLAGAGLAALAACNSNEADTYFCVNGPDLVAAYSETGVTLFLNDDSVHTLTRSDPARPNLYSNAQGTVWSVGGNDARLDKDRESFLCDLVS